MTLALQAFGRQLPIATTVYNNGLDSQWITTSYGCLECEVDDVQQVTQLLAVMQNT